MISRSYWFAPLPSALSSSRLSLDFGLRPADLYFRQLVVPDVEKVIVPRLRSAGHGQQADEIIAARAFGAMLDRTRDVIAEVTQYVEPVRGGIPISQIAREGTMRKALSALRTVAENFRLKADVAEVTEQERSSIIFADAIARAQNDADAIEFLVSRVRDVLVVSDGSVLRGPLFRVVDRVESLEGLEDSATRIEPDRTVQNRTGRTFRIANFHSLLRDVAQ